MRRTRFTRDHVVLTKEHLEDVVAYFKSRPAFAFDVETTPPTDDSQDADRGEPTVNRVVWISLATYGLAVTIPMGHPNGDVQLTAPRRRKNRVTGKMDMFPATYDEPPEQLYPSEVFAALEPLFFGDKVIIAHNASFDVASIAKYYEGKVPTGEINCTIVLQWLLNENLLQYGLKPLTEKQYGVKYDHENVGRRIEHHSFSTVAHYGLMDVRYTWLRWIRQRPNIEHAELQNVFKLECDLTPVLVRMRLRGVAVDRKRLEELQVDLTKRRTDLEVEVYRLAGTQFNINSNVQLARILFDSKDNGGQGIRSKVLTDGGMKVSAAGGSLDWSHYSTSEKTLKKYRGNAFVDALLEYAKISKILSTYVEGYLGVPGVAKRPCRIYNGRIHTDFVQYGTVSGRLSSREPNLQNVPRPGEEDDDLGRKIRNLFLATPGYALVDSDYDQIEMRLLAHFAKRGALADAISAGMDPHSATAAGLASMSLEVFNEKKAAGDSLIKRLRQAAKAINFAVIYGAESNKVAEMAGISVPEAEKFLASYDESFPEVEQFKNKCLRTARSREFPHIRTISGRKRRVRDLNSSQFGLRKRAERQTINSLIQGSSGDLTKMAMVYLDRILPPEMHLVLTVHDELLVESPVDRVKECQALMREAMLGEHIQSLVRVPITADSNVADRWGDCK